ncbi:MAG: hypothetical protein WD004_07180 [Actinomycetota bacterium]
MTLPRSLLAAVIAGAFLAIAATTALVLTGWSVWAGVASSLATVLLVGSVWAAGGRRVAGFLSAVADRAYDAAVLSSLAWVLRDAVPQASLAALLTLAGGFLGAYVVSRGRALGFAAPTVPWERGLRCALVSVALLTGSMLPLWAAAAFALAIALSRAFIVPRGAAA